MLSSSVQRLCRQHSAQLHSCTVHRTQHTAQCTQSSTAQLHTELCCCCPNYARRLIFSKPGILKHLKGAARFPRFSVFTHILCSLETQEGEHTFFGICADFLYLCLKLVFCVNWHSVYCETWRPAVRCWWSEPSRRETGDCGNSTQIEIIETPALSSHHFYVYVLCICIIHVYVCHMKISLNWNNWNTSRIFIPMCVKLKLNLE